MTIDWGHLHLPPYYSSQEAAELHDEASRVLKAKMVDGDIEEGWRWLQEEVNPVGDPRAWWCRQRQGDEWFLLCKWVPCLMIRSVVKGTLPSGLPGWIASLLDYRPALPNNHLAMKCMLLAWLLRMIPKDAYLSQSLRIECQRQLNAVLRWVWFDGKVMVWEDIRSKRELYRSLLAEALIVTAYGCREEHGKLSKLKDKLGKYVKAEYEWVIPVICREGSKTLLPLFVPFIP
jgi:hypothetical protein